MQPHSSSFLFFFSDDIAGRRVPSGTTRFFQPSGGEVIFSPAGKTHRDSRRGDYKYTNRFKNKKNKKKKTLHGFWRLYI